jgi:hypothetical protein
MAKCNFSLPFSGPASAIIAKAKKSIEDQGGSFHGDDISGSFSVNSPVGGVYATYLIEGQNLNVAVTKKPIVLSCDKIEEFLRKQLPKTINV